MKKPDYRHFHLLHARDNGPSDRAIADDKGKTLFSYAHPLFWSPYTIIIAAGDARVHAQAMALLKEVA